MHRTLGNDRLSSLGRSAVAGAWLLAALALPAEAAPGDRSPDGLWAEVDRSALGAVTAPLPRAFTAYRLDLDRLRAALATAPMEDLARTAAPAGLVIFIPLADGMFAPVAVERSPVLSRTLALQYPEIATFAFRGVADGGISGRMTLDPSGFQALMRPPADLARITPFATAMGTFYLSFLNHDRTDGADDFRLLHDEPREPHDEPPPVPLRLPAAPAVAGLGVQSVTAGGTLRQFRLAASTTGEYYQARAGAGGVNDVVASIVAEVNNVNLVFETELAVRLSLDWLLLYDDPDTDPYTAGDTACMLRDENVAATNAVLTLADYDIGYVFGQGGGNGCAWYVVCLNDKARGAGLVNTAILPGGSTGLLAHEMGHQLGGRHTFSGGASGCTATEFNPTSAYEPGSGSTIMSYLGNCGSDNVVTTVALPAGQYYHTNSFDEIINNITSGSGTCGSSFATGNNPPVVDAGADYTIPRGTPFTLSGSAMDADGDPLTFNWEQFDVAATQRSIDTDPGDGPIFRSVQPTSDSSRTFPTLSDILANTQTPGEILPSTDRTLTFRLTARDNRTGAGGVAYDTAVLTVAGDPFAITSPNGGESFGAGCPMPVSWTVGGGSVASEVSLDLSLDGGNGFAPLLASTANDGSAMTVAPCANAALARVRAAAIDNVFFDISDGDFSIQDVPPTASITAMGGEVDDQCQFTVTFSGSVTDDCGVSAADVQVQAFKLQDDFDLGPVQLTAMQVDATTVSVSGSVLVSNLTSSPAVVTLLLTAIDACNGFGSDDVQAAVTDTTPPTISVSLSPTTLWPPNHKLRDITALVSVADNCPGTSFVLSSITSDEPDNGLGDGDTVNDIQQAMLGTADLGFSLRAERSGKGDGRTYTVTYTATDGSDNESMASAVVEVPHDK